MKCTFVMRGYTKQACVESLVTKTSKRTDKRLIERIQAGEIEFEDLAPRVEDAGAGRCEKSSDTRTILFLYFFFYLFFSWFFVSFSAFQILYNYVCIEL